MCLGILERTKAKNKTLPKLLETALILQSGLIYYGDCNILEDIFKNHKSLYENNRQECSYKGPLHIAPTVLARYGTGFSVQDEHDNNLHDITEK